MTKAAKAIFTDCLRSTGGRPPREIRDILLGDEVVGWYARDLRDYSLSPEFDFTPTPLGARMGFKWERTDSPRIAAIRQFRALADSIREGEK